MRVSSIPAEKPLMPPKTFYLCLQTEKGAGCLHPKLATAHFLPTGVTRLYFHNAKKTVFRLMGLA